MTVPTARMLATAAALLDQGRSVDRLSGFLTVAALGGAIAGALLTTPRPVLLVTLCLSAVAGLAETYLAIRVGFDAALLRGLVVEAQSGTPNLRALDDALARLGLVANHKGERQLEDRLRGAQRLFYRQLAATAVQAALIALGVLASIRW